MKLFNSYFEVVVTLIALCIFLYTGIDAIDWKLLSAGMELFSKQNSTIILAVFLDILATLMIMCALLFVLPNKSKAFIWYIERNGHAIILIFTIVIICQVMAFHFTNFDEWLLAMLQNKFPAQQLVGMDVESSW